MPWKLLLAWATGQIDDTLRQKLEFVLEENHVYRALLDRHSPHWRLNAAERKPLAEKGKPLGKLLSGVIRNLISRHRLTTLMVTHSVQQAANLGDRIIIMHKATVACHFAGASKQRLGVDDLLASFEELRRREMLDETVGDLLRESYAAFQGDSRGIFPAFTELQPQVE